MKIEKYLDRKFYPGDIEAATEGYCTRKTQQLWHHREIWLTPTAVPEAGKPRPYDLQHVYEAAILATGLQYGLSLPQARAAIENRLMQLAVAKERKRSGHTAVWEGEVCAAIYDVPEFAAVDVDDPVYWAIYMGRGWVQASHRPNVVGVRPFKGDVPLSNATRDCPMVVVMNITSVIARVNGVLKQRAAASSTDEPDDVAAT